MNAQPRTPAGVPTGGQFAASYHDEVYPDVLEDVDPDIVAEISAGEERDEAIRDAIGRTLQSRLGRHGSVTDSEIREWGDAYHEYEAVSYFKQGDYVELARKFSECCPTQRNGPAWDWVDGGRITGSWGGQCGGCGGQGGGWVRTGASDLSDVPDEELSDRIEKMLTELDAQWDEAVERKVTEVTTELERDLRDARDLVASGDAELDDYPSLDNMTEPGVGRDDEGLVAWDYDPRDSTSSDFIEVR